MRVALEMPEVFLREILDNVPIPARRVFDTRQLLRHHSRVQRLLSFAPWKIA
ncbi:MAG: hypothetical protein ACR2JC_08105 [Chloroflexota bacterium]